MEFLQEIYLEAIDMLKSTVLMPLSYVLSAAFGYLIALLRKIFHRTISKKVLKMGQEDKKELTVFTANSGQYDEQELVTLGYIFEYISVGELNTAFKSIYRGGKLDVKMSNEKVLGKRVLNDNLVLIGGPYHNCVTRELVFNGKNNLPLSFDDNANLTVLDGNNVLVYKPETGGDVAHYYENDYGIIMNIKNPNDTSKRIISFIGCRSIGCLGAADYFLEKQSEFSRQIKRNDEEYAVIVRCSGNNEKLYETPTLEKYVAFKTNPIPYVG